MAISVQVPKDLSGIKTKVALNLTKRQIICFSGAAVAGIPLYFLTKGLIGTSAASLLMMGAMLPFFFFAMYEKNGFPAEKILYFMLRQKILTPGIRPYRSENLYKQLEEKEKLRREVRYLEEKAKGRTGKPQKTCGSLIDFNESPEFPPDFNRFETPSSPEQQSGPHDADQKHASTPAKEIAADQTNAPAVQLFLDQQRKHQCHKTADQPDHCRFNSIPVFRRRQQHNQHSRPPCLSLIHISEPTRRS